MSVAAANWHLPQCLEVAGWIARSAANGRNPGALDWQPPDLCGIVNNATYNDIRARDSSGLRLMSWPPLVTMTASSGTPARESIFTNR